MNYFRLTFLIAVLGFLFSCSEQSRNHSEKIISFEYDTSNISAYMAIIDSLKPYGYVHYFRMFKQFNFDFENQNINAEERTFMRDSIAYYKARENFFNQDREFLHWLLSFKNDTVVDPNQHERTLWKPFINPYLSIVSPCMVHTSKSRQAINLIYGILDGEKIDCVECDSGNLGDPACAIHKYEYVETFLQKNDTKTIAELREIWKPMN